MLKDNNRHLRSHINIALASDNKYAPYTATTIASIINNNPKSNSITFYYLIPPNFKNINKIKTLALIKDKNQYSIEFINMKNAFLNTKSTIKHLTNQTYYRLLLANIIKSKKCLYLDSDTIVEKDLQELFQTKLGHKYIAGVKAAGHHTPDGNPQHCKLIGIENINQYINAGVILLNLEQIRKNHITDKFLDLEKKNLPSDQDIINAGCFDNILHLPLKYNSMTPYFSTSEKEKNAIRIFGEKQVREAKQNPVIIHFVSERKPWNDQNIPKSDRFWYYFKKTPYWNKYIQHKINIKINNLLVKIKDYKLNINPLEIFTKTK